MAKEYWRQQKCESDLRVRVHHSGPQGAKPKAEVVAKILTDIKERKA